MPIQKILVPTDFSTPAEIALETAIELARSCRASLTLFHVCTLPLPPSGDALDPFTPETIGELEAAARTELAAARVAILRRWPDHGGVIEERLALGAPFLAILEEARAGAYDLVVMGTHGRTGMRRLLIGSVTERVMRAAPCPVVAVPGRLGTRTTSAHDVSPADSSPPEGAGATAARADADRAPSSPTERTLP